MLLGKLSLTNLGKGAAVEKFDHELGEVLTNILDPNTEATAKRRIVLEVTIRPNKDRRMGAVSVSCTSKTAAPVAFNTMAYFGREKGQAEVVAFENNPNQLSFDDIAEAQPENVAALPAKKEAAK